jgi:hypothetical protein
VGAHLHAHGGLEHRARSGLGEHDGVRHLHRRRHLSDVVRVEGAGVVSRRRDGARRGAVARVACCPSLAPRWLAPSRRAPGEAEDVPWRTVLTAPEVSMTQRWNVSFLRRASAYRPSSPRPSCAGTYRRWRRRAARRRCLRSTILSELSVRNPQPHAFTQYRHDMSIATGWYR